MRHLSRSCCALLFALTLAVFLSASHHVTAQSPIATIPVGTAPFGADVNTVTNRIYVVNTANSSVSVIDGATNTVITTINNVGNQPTDIAVNSVTNKIYVAGGFAQGTVVIDGTTNTVTTTVSTGNYAFRVSVNPVTNMVYVSSSGLNLTVINGATDTVVTNVPMPTGNAYASAVNTATNKIYVCDAVNNAVNVINGATNTFLTTITVGASPQKIGANSTTNRIYVANYNSMSVTVVNGATDAVVTTIPTSGNPFGVGVDTVDDKIFVANQANAPGTTTDPVDVISGASNLVLRTFAAGDQPSAAVVNPSTRRIYVTNQGSNNVSVFGIASTMLISEFRFSGANTQDEFVELYNNTDQPLTVSTTDGSSGWSLVSNDSGATTVRFTIPNGTVIPARGHYLGASSPFIGGYTLTGYAVPDVSMIPADIPNGAGVALFRTSNPANFTLANRLDAVGYAGVSDPFYFEGTPLPPSGGIAPSATQYSWVRDLSHGTPQDSDNNSADFRLVSTNGGMLGGVQSVLGAPGPQARNSPTQRNAQLPLSQLDATASPSAAPNRFRDSTSNPSNNSTFGTLSIRRRVTNNTGAPVTRLRFRVVIITGFPVPDAATADVRAITSSDISVTVNDPTQCMPNPTPCNVTVRGTTLEEPPAQPNGGGLNTSLTVPAVTTSPVTSAPERSPRRNSATRVAPAAGDTIALGVPLSAGQSINVQLLLGVQRTGFFRFYINVEALP